MNALNIGARILAWRPEEGAAVRFSRTAVAVCLLPLFTVSTVDARPALLKARHTSIDLPGPPVVLIGTDLNGDGRTDLVVLDTYTEWDRVAFDTIEDAVMVLEVVPALFNRREIRVFLANDEGEYALAAPALDVSERVLALARGPAASPVIALTSEGVAALRLAGEGDDAHITLEMLIEDPPVFADTGSFLPRLEFTTDLDGDGAMDLLLPAADGLAVHLARNGRLEREATFRLPTPGEQHHGGERPMHLYPLPLIEDIDGDGTVDLLFTEEISKIQRAQLLRGLGQGRFAPPAVIDLSAILPQQADDSEERSVEQAEDEKRTNQSAKVSYSPPRMAYFGDLDGDKRAEIVTASTRQLNDEAGMRDHFREAKVPHLRFAFHHLDASLAVDPHPYTTLDAVGYEFGGGWPDISSNAFKDLDGDGRKDLVTITLDFSLFQALRVLVTKRMSIGLDFHVWHQASDSTFNNVTGLDLSEKLKLRLSNFRLGRIAQFAGDFDGDGRTDFVHLGRGKKVTIHPGQDGARYPVKAELAIELNEVIDALELVRVLDINRDGRVDLAITRPLKRPDPEATAPVRVELYLTEDAR